MWKFASGAAAVCEATTQTAFTHLSRGLTHATDCIYREPPARSARCTRIVPVVREVTTKYALFERLEEGLLTHSAGIRVSDKAMPRRNVQLLVTAALTVREIGAAATPSKDLLPCPAHPSCHGRVDHKQRPWPADDVRPPRVELISVGPTDKHVVMPLLKRFNASFVQCTATNAACPKRNTYSRDSQAMVTYLATNYERLPERMAFMHGHIRAWHQTWDFLERFGRAIESELDYVNIGHLSNTNTVSQNHSLREWCKVFWPQVETHVARSGGPRKCPQTVCYIMGLQLVVSRQAVRRLPREFYLIAERFLYDGLDGDADIATGPDAPLPDVFSRLALHTPSYRASFNTTLHSFLKPSTRTARAVAAAATGGHPHTNITWQRAWLQTIQQRNSFMLEALSHVFWGQPACLQCPKASDCLGLPAARCKATLKSVANQTVIRRATQTFFAVSCI